MDEKQSHPAGNQVAASGTGANSNGLHPQFTTENAEAYPADSMSQMLADLQALASDAKVEPADVLSAQKVAALLPTVATYQGLALQAAFDSLRILIGYLPADEREALYPAFVEHKLFVKHADWEKYLASCPLPPGAPHFKPLTLAELLAMPPKIWLIDQVIGRGDLAMLYGPPGSGKTFVVIDLVFAACLGQQFALRFEVARRLQVAYCAGEGASGLPARFAAAAEHYDVIELPSLTVFDAAPQLFDGDSLDTIVRFVNEWREREAAGAAEPLDLLVIDTLHSASVGADENSAQDMGKVLSLAKWATKELGCAVLLVHHSNKQGNAERGSSAMRGAMDAMIEIKPVTGKFAMSCEKLKDGEQWKPQTFDLTAKGESVRVWWDEVSELPSGGQRHSEALLAELRRRPGVKFTAKQLAEAVGASQSAAINALSRMAEKGEIMRSLLDETRDPSSRNPWVYFVEKG